MKLATWLLGLLLVLPGTGKAAQYVEWQGFEIHYTVVPSMAIPASVARLHDITRSRHRLVTNVSVLKDGTAVRARVNGTATNLLAQRESLKFREVTEQDAIYYLATQIVSERDRLDFSIDITPEGLGDTYRLEFLRTYE